VTPEDDVRSPLFVKFQPPPGSRPGTLVIPPGSPKPRIFVSQYTRDSCEEHEVQDVEELPALVARTEGNLWVDVRGLGDERVLKRIGQIFALHALALEDAVNVPQRAKTRDYEEHQVVVARGPILGEDGGIVLPQLFLSIGPRHLLTIQERHFGFLEPVRGRLRDGLGPMRSHGPDYLAYALIDAVIDRYFPVADAISNRLEELEEAITDEPDPETLIELHRVRRQLVVLRRVGRPQQEALSTLVRQPSKYFGEDVRALLNDTRDHFSQVIELLDSSRELAVGLTEVYLSELGHRSNEIMKLLTLMASIFIPLTFVAGIYGMNFEYMPELHSRQAYPVVLALMAIVAVGMIGYFRYRGWLGGGRRSFWKRSGK